MRVLVACEFSGTVRDAFRNRGHDTWSCDLLCDDRNSDYHMQGDVMPITRLQDRWELMIAFPPCQFICNSGVRWLHTDKDRWGKLDKAAAFFRGLLDAPIPRIAIENSIPHRYAIERIGKKYSQIIHPWQHGHGESKATCLWLENLPELTPTKIVEGRVGRIHRMAPSPERSKKRSITYAGIATAMASQWG